MKNEITEQQKHMQVLRDALTKVEQDRENGILGVTINELDRLLSDAIEDTP